MFYYYQDELGSTSHIASASGALIESYQYDVYGKPRVYDASGVYQSGATPIARFLQGGARWMPELGLYDDRNRFMSPDLGRFIQPDPIGFKGDASNLYRYCGNDWANKTDPMGLQSADQAVGSHGAEYDVKLKENAEQFNKSVEQFNAHKVEAARALDPKLGNLKIPDAIDKMIGKVKNNPTQFHDLNFVKSVVTQVIQAFLQGRIQLAGPQSLFYPNNPMKTPTTPVPRIILINPKWANTGNARVDNSHALRVGPLLGHEGSHLTENPVPRLNSPEWHRNEATARDVQRQFDRAFGTDSLHEFSPSGL